MSKKNEEAGANEVVDTTTDTSENSNLNLWNEVRTPPDSALKKFRRAGGFAGTAIEPMWLIKKATSLWGPIGGEWGIAEDTIEDHFVNGSDGQIMHYSRFILYTPVGKVPCVGQTMFVMKTKHGLVTDEEAPKKSMTDALGWGLSRLGFAADVYMGLHDGNKYVHSPGGNDETVGVPQSLPAGEHEVKPLDFRVLKEGNGWTMYAIQTDKGEVVTFDEAVITTCKTAKDNGKAVKLKIETSRGKNKVTGATIIG